jgi:hypothetical protein
MNAADSATSVTSGDLRGARRVNPYGTRCVVGSDDPRAALGPKRGFRSNTDGPVVYLTGGSRGAATSLLMEDAQVERYSHGVTRRGDAAFANHIGAENICGAARTSHAPTNGTDTREPQSRPRDTRELVSRLESLAAADSEYWSFAGNGHRDYLHSLLRYPAMMVPRLQRELLETCISWDPSIERIYDPFVGSGTVMTEAMLLGRSFVGTDINPLAILTCRAKSEFLDASALGHDLIHLLDAADADTSDAIDIEFPHMRKWFEPHVLTGLCRIRRAILGRRYGRTRRFWWVVLAETTRLVSNSRTSTVKLHLRPASEIENRPDPLSRFRELAERSVGIVATQQEILERTGLLTKGVYKRRIEVEVADVRGFVTTPADLLMSSPPYGDNHTTVTYGQASYLPLQWVPTRDVGDGFDAALCASTHSTDTASLGGASSRFAIRDAERALDRSPTLRRALDELRDQPLDRRTRVAGFFRDLDLSLDSVMDNLRAGAIMMWTVGDRSVGGRRIPMALVLRQLLGTRAEYVTDLTRSIPAAAKRMPTRNALTSTMGSETILVLRKTT